MTQPARGPFTIRVAHRYAASPERVFDAWLDPQLIARWMFGHTAQDEMIVSVAVDARVGGTFSFVVRRGGQDIDHIGEYLEIDRPRRLVFTWGVRAEVTASSVVAIDVAPADGGAELTLAHELHPDWAEYAAQTERGWTVILGAIDEALSTSEARGGQKP